MLSSAELYDYIYSWKPYAEEADIIHSYLQKFSLRGNNLIELACGTGRYIEYLSQYWNCTGVDLCSDSLNIAKRRAPEASFVHADMSTISLREKYSVAICLFGGISYLKEEELSIALENWYNLLDEGGVLIVEPWREEQSIHFDQPFLQSYFASNFRLSRMVSPRKEGNACVLDFFFLLAIAGHKVQRLQQRDVLQLHSWDNLRSRIQGFGFAYMDSIPSFLEDGTMWVFRKR